MFNVVKDNQKGVFRKLKSHVIQLVLNVVQRYLLTILTGIFGFGSESSSSTISTKTPINIETD